MRVLITGFGPFPGVAENSSGPVALALAERLKHRLPEARPTALVLPTEWRAAPALLDYAADRLQPSVCLHLGVSGLARGVVAEGAARNYAAPKADAVGAMPHGEAVLADAPPVLVPAFDTRRFISAAARAGHPVADSAEPGDYVCNTVFYRSLWSARRRTGRLAAFLHLPVGVGRWGRFEEAGREPHRLPLEAALALCEQLVAHMLAEGAAPQAIEAAP